MLSINDCLLGNRPLIFVVCENDIELLNYLNENKAHNFFIYSKTLTNLVPLDDLLSTQYQPKIASRKTDIEVLDTILHWEFKEVKANDTYIFLDCDLNDKQVIRKIKDILGRFQLDTEFLISMVFVSQCISIPQPLERMGELVFFDTTEKAAREKVETITAGMDLSDEERPSEEVISNLKGLTLFEIEQAFTQSWQLHGKIDIDFIRSFKKSAIVKTGFLSLIESDVTFNHIGGMDVLKEWIRKSSGGWTVKGQEYGLPNLKGVLLIGLPGCGKSLAAKALGNEWKLPLIQFDPSKVFSSRVGESESNLRRVLQMIENISPCILFIDEIEKGFAGSQSSSFSDAGVTARILGTFLTWMQDCVKPVFTVATSNNIAYLPPEMIQRFDEKFFVNLPSPSEQSEIYNIQLKKVRRDPVKFDIEKLVKNSKDLSGREIEQVIKESMYDSFYKGKEIDTENVLEVLKKKTNLLSTMAEQLKFILDWVEWDEEKKDGKRARFASKPDSIEIYKIQSEIDSLIKDIEKKKPFSRE
jgi:AAA+ superfamily predicted ATPase